MSNLVPVLSLGFALGITHAADADHVVAVSTMVGDRRGPALKSAARIGTMWAIGHSASVLLVGGAMIAFRLVVPESLSATLELAVAVMLVALGISSLRRSPHQHATEPGGAMGRARGFRSLGVGVLHGLAGSAAVGLAVLSQTTSAAAGLGYLACFGVGTLAGMVLLTVVMAVPFAVTNKSAGIAKWLRIGAGVASIAVGVVLFVTVLGGWIAADA